MAKKSLIAQHIANAFPLWSDMRTNEQSLGRQFLNPVGNTLDEMFEQVQKIADNYYISTACISDIDVYYYVRLPETFEFDKLDGDNTEWIYTTPTVSGLVGSTYYPVTIAEENNVENFWYKATPTRISLETTATNACLLASGILQYSPIPLIVTSGLLDVPNKLHVTVSGGTAYIYADDYNYVSRTVVQIEGQSRAGGDITEELYFIHADTIQTRNEFQQVYEVRTYHTPYNNTATIRIDAAGFNMTDHPAAYQLARNEYKENVLMYWGVGDGYIAGQRTLNVRKYDTDEILNRLGGYTDKHNAISFEMLDASGNYVDARDVAVEPHSDRIWVVSSGMLYLFDSDLYYPNTQTMINRNYDANVVIEPSSYYIVPGETVTLYYVWKRPVTDIKAYRIWVIKPSGTKYSISAGAEIPYVTGTSSWEAGPLMINRNLQSPDTFTLTETGDHTYCIEARYTDDTSSVDKKIICVQSKTAKAEFNISAATGDIDPIEGIDIDSEYKIWVRDNKGYKFQLKPHYDNMIIDWQRKVIYLREPYDQVRVLDYD